MRLGAGPDRQGGRPAERRRVLRVRDGRFDERPDFLAAEDPLEVRLEGAQVAVTMRTPGHDTELAVGFLVGEGIVRPEDVAGVTECRSADGDGGVADVRLRPGARASAGWQRNFSLGTSVLLVSGRASFELVQKAVVAGIAFVAAVSAPSTLAVELAAESNATLVGFLRPGGFNVYAGRERIAGLA